jgi:putative DNA primase/helicase
LIDFNDTKPFGLDPLRYDLDEIVRRLRDTAEQWVPSHFPNGRRNADEWRLANIRGDAPRKQGSCVITLKGEHAGDWIDFDGNAGGGPLSALENATGLSGRALYAYAAELVGWMPGKPPVRSTSPVPSTKSGADRTQDVVREIDFILSRDEPIAGSPAAAYLGSRGLAVPETPDLLFHPDVTYWDTKTGHPAMVAIVRDARGERTAIHRTYLRADGSGKAGVAKQRMMLGPVAGATVRLVEPGDGGVIGIAEGIETGLSVMQACSHLPVWAALSAGNMEQTQLPPEALRVVLLADHDAAGAGLRAAHRAARRFHGEGRRVWIAMPPSEGDDFNDVLRRDGPDAVRMPVEAAAEWAPDTTGKEAGGAPETTADKPRHRPTRFAPPTGPRPVIRADDGDLARVSDKCWNVLVESNDPPWLFRCAGQPVWIERDKEQRPIPVQITENRMRHALARLATWIRKSPRSDDPVPAHPPIASIKDVLAKPDPDIPPLDGIVTAPVFGPSGDLLTTPGYHPSTGLLYEPDEGFHVPTVPERPTQVEIDAARGLLLDELFGEFPFVGEAERAHALALILLPFVRPMIDGPTPLHMIEKPTAGTGAGLMIDVISTVTTGCGASVMVEGRDDEEWRKRITAKLRTVPTLLLLDNLKNLLDSSSVAAALTAPYWEDRILGRSDMTRIPVRCVWIATGNNPKVSNEIARRCVRIRLDARVDRPWNREGFRHPHLTNWVRGERPRLVAACLTLVRGWIAAGRPRHSRPLGSFEVWAGTMGGILEVAGVPGFLGNLKEMYEASDAEGTMWRTFVAQWWDRFGSAEVGTADLHGLATDCEPPLPLGDGAERSQRIRLGKALGRMRDRMFTVGEHQLRIGAAGSRQRAQQWMLVVEKFDAGKHSPHSPEGTPESECAPREGQHSLPHSPEIREQNQRVSECGEYSECFSNTYTYARTHVHAIETPGKHSPHSPHSLSPENSKTCSSECGGEGAEPHSQATQTAGNRWEEVI